ncbi:MAG: hypothetical protein LBQ77_03855 [Treponema sp.]|nr:hypothetical protein [Treponema sp.]
MGQTSVFEDRPRVIQRQTSVDSGRPLSFGDRPLFFGDRLLLIQGQPSIDSRTDLCRLGTDLLSFGDRPLAFGDRPLSIQGQPSIDSRTDLCRFGHRPPVLWGQTSCHSGTDLRLWGQTPCYSETDLC